MVNYRRASEAALLVAVVAVAIAAPLHGPDCKEQHVYDQRQNGSENYRLNIDGVVIAVAPAESLLSAVSDIDLSDLFDIDNLSEQGKPKPPSNIGDLLLGEEPPVRKPDEKPGVQSKPEEKPKPEDKPKPENKPDDLQDFLENKPETPNKPKEEKGQKKSAALRKHEASQRLKHRLASIFMPFLRKRRHQ